MSGLRHGLDEWAQQHGARVAAAVAGREPAMRELIRTRRRNRIAATAATAMVGLAGVVAIASALPGINQAPPADQLRRHLSELTCGDPWTVPQGTTTYAEDADSYFEAPQGDWVLTDGDGGARTEFSGFTAGQGSVAWQGTIKLSGHTIVRGRVVAVKDGVIVGVAEDQYARSYTGGSARLTASAPNPGPCGDTTSGGRSGEVTYHLVLQLRRVSADGGPVATIVDPGGARRVAVDGVEAWVTSRAVKASGPSVPQGRTYQAFVVPRPTAAACQPLRGQLKDGALPRNSMTVNELIPGLKPLADVLGEDSPVIDSSVSLGGTWYGGRDAWLVVQDGANQERSLGWSADLTRLAPSKTAPPPPETVDCFLALQSGPPSGAVYLVIDGIDRDAVDAAYPTLDFDADAMQTWVYLGQAG